MEQMNCDIIRDLIPSYVDEVCSESTKRCVEEHLGSCGGCRQMLETYKGHSLSGKKLEQKELDSLKKIKNRMKFQNAVCYIILVFLLYCGFEVFFANHINYVLFSHPALLFVICILANLLFSIGYKCRTPLGKAEYLLGAVSFVLDLYFILLFLYFAARLRTATEISQTILGMELQKMGPFLERQIIAAFVAQILFFIYNLWCVIRRDKNCSWLLCLNMTGIFLTINYDLWMKGMDSVETMWHSIFTDTLEIAIPGLIGVAASFLISRHVQKRIL